VRPFQENERRLIPILHRSTLLLAGIHWVRWIGAEGRVFEHWPRVWRRIDEILADLDSLAALR
jgi:hypothetical protein